MDVNDKYIYIYMYIYIYNAFQHLMQKRKIIIIKLIAGKSWNIGQI